MKVVAGISHRTKVNDCTGSLLVHRHVVQTSCTWQRILVFFFSFYSSLEKLHVINEIKPQIDMICDS